MVGGEHDPVGAKNVVHGPEGRLIVHAAGRDREIGAEIVTGLFVERLFAGDTHFKRVAIIDPVEQKGQSFAQMAELCRQYKTHLGVWLSPFGGYGEPRTQRLKFGGAQGYETNATGFSLAGPKYFAAFKRACVEMIREYGVNHFKFDGIASGMYANGAGADYILDTEAMRRLMLELRQEDPAVYINLTTGSWPSPFWLRYADSVWRQGGDMGRAGKEIGRAHV